MVKSKLESGTEDRNQVFLSYAAADKLVAQRIVQRLRQEGLRVWFDQAELKVGDSIDAALYKALSASDYIVVLLSPDSVQSGWVRRELAAALSRDLTARDITLLPVLIADCEIPLLLATYQFLDLRTDFEQGVDLLVKQIAAAPGINFSELDGRAFEDLVADLLVELGFTNIEREAVVRDFPVDIKAQYSHTDPFGIEVTDTWLVEIKLYRQGRADLKSVNQLVGYLSALPARSKGLLITNGQLTSAAKQWLESTEASTRIEIRVIDGTELKRLLLQHRDLIDKHFTRGRAAR